MASSSPTTEDNQPSSLFKSTLSSYSNYSQLPEWMTDSDSNSSESEIFEENLKGLNYQQPKPLDLEEEDEDAIMGYVSFLRCNRPWAWGAGKKMTSEYDKLKLPLHQRRPTFDWDPQPKPKIPGITFLDHSKDPVCKLNISENPFSSSSLDVGSVTEIKAAKQFPRQTNKKGIKFELSSESAKYEEMEQKMKKIYKGRQQKGIAMPYQKVLKDNYAVVAVSRGDGTFTYKRARICKDMSTAGEHCVFPRSVFCLEVELTDHSSKMLISNPRHVFSLEREFSVLPPRNIHGIKLQWLEHFKGLELYKRFIRNDSDEYLFNGVLCAKKQANGKFIVWSDKFPEHKFPEGINGYILRTLVNEIAPDEIRLPFLQHIKPGVQVSHADDSGYVHLQFQGNLLATFLEIEEEAQEKIEEHFGSVLYPLKLNDWSKIYFAPHEASNGYFYRCRALSQKKKKIHVQFIDYGDEADVKVGELVRVENVNPLFSIFPPFSTKAHLANIQSLKSKKFLSDKWSASDSVQVVSETTEYCAEVILRFFTKSFDSPSVNERIVKKKLGEEIVKDYDYLTRSVLKIELKGSERDSMRLRLYLGLGFGQRLYAGDVYKFHVTYHDSMEERAFLIPTDRLEKRFELDNLLRKFVVEKNEERKEIEATEKFVLGPAKLDLRRFSRMLCFSRLTQRHVRVMLLSESHAAYGIETDANKVQWEVYLVDYGLKEFIEVRDLFSMMPGHADLPSLGVRARLVGELDATEKRAEWYAKSQYDEPDRITGRHQAYFKVISILNDYLGEKIYAQRNE